MQLGPNLQRSGEEIGDGLPCCSIYAIYAICYMLYSGAQPAACSHVDRAQDVIVQGDNVMPLFLVVSGTRCRSNAGEPTGSLLGIR